MYLGIECKSACWNMKVLVSQYRFHQISDKKNTVTHNGSKHEFLSQTLAILYRCSNDIDFYKNDHYVSLFIEICLMDWAVWSPLSTFICFLRSSDNLTPFEMWDATELHLLTGKHWDLAFYLFY